MNDLHFIQNLRFCVFVSNSKTYFVADGGVAPVLFQNESAVIAHKLWKSAASPRHQGDLLSGIIGPHHETEVSQAVARMLHEGILIAGSQQDIASSSRQPSRNLACERLLVCMSGAIQTAHFSQYLVALRLGFCQELKIVLTATARKFVRRRALGQLLEAEIHIDAFEGTVDSFGVPHIELAEWASCILVAPATASTIHRIAHVTCSDLLSLVIAAAPLDTPVVIGPSMNARMWDNSVVQQNVQLCRQQGYWVIEPGMGVEANTPWNARTAQGGVFGATPSTLLNAMRAIYGADVR